jgi:hypothetical protein
MEVTVYTSIQCCNKCARKINIGELERKKRMAEETIKREAIMEEKLNKIYNILISMEGECQRKLGVWALHPTTFGHQMALKSEGRIKEWIDEYEECDLI